ncbi:MAG: hypothetical protein K2X91_04115 [Thermoleophilia bacterium]|nr:hypothetical protein [Thermoleophilia bacterium]
MTDEERSRLENVEQYGPTSSDLPRLALEYLARLIVEGVLEAMIRAATTGIRGLAWILRR